MVVLYNNIVKGKFIKRINRFIALVDVGGKIYEVHVKNTGRLKELLKDGAEILLEKSDNTERKTLYDLVAVYKNDMLINIDSQAPNKVFHAYLKSGKMFSDISLIKPEYKYKNSRMDFYVEAGKRKILIEIKGVTLENEGTVSFPDAPTERGIKHINELSGALSEGYEAYIVFVVQLSGAKEFVPNDKTHKAFGDALRNANKAGVKIFAFDCDVYENGFEIKNRIKVNSGDKNEI